MVDPDPDERIGSVLDGRYRVLERLAEGGMGVVYRGERVPVGRAVAVKFLHDVYASDRESRARFERETRVLCKLAHPHCVSVIDFGVSGSPYLVMDYVTGPTLRDLLEEGPIAVNDAITIAKQVLAGLAHAHAQGVIHRDIKPANIMVSEEIGTGIHVKILDFGLARLHGGAATSVTQTSIVVGTPNYMPPEQTLAAEVDARADLYSVGVILFEMVTGQRPFNAEETAAVLDKHRNEPPPHLDSIVKTALPAGLDDVIQRALAKRPDDRFPSAVDMAEALDAVVQGREVPAAPLVTRRRRERGPNWMMAVLLLGALAGGVYFATRLVKKDAKKPGPGTGSALVAKGSGAGAGAGKRGKVKDAATAALAAKGADAAPLVKATPDAAPTVAVTATPDAAVEIAAVAPPDAATVAVIDMVDAAIDPENPPEEAVASADPTVEQDPAQAEPDTEDGEAPPPVVVPPPVVPPPVVPPKPITSIRQAINLVKKGQREDAIKGLRQLWRKYPQNSNVPYVLGNLYFDKHWWSIALEHYGAAIKRNQGHRFNKIIIGNTIRMLAHAKTRGKASWFLLRVIGKPARKPIWWAVRHHPKKSVRKWAWWQLKRQMPGGRK